MIKPSFEEFRRLAKKYNCIPVYQEVLADALTPVALLASRWDKSTHAFLLESIEGGERLARYSMVGFDPTRVLEEKKGVSTWSGHRSHSAGIPRSALDELARYMRSVRVAPVAGLPLFFGGAVGYLGYETVHNLEKLPRTKPDALKWPDSIFLISDDLFVFDNTQQLIKAISCVPIKKGMNLKSAYAAAARRVRERMRWIQDAAKHPLVSQRAQGKPAPFVSNIDKRDFTNAVRKAKEHIGRGDIIQIVLSRRQQKKTTASPLDIYRCLRVVNPSPYMFLIKAGTRALIGSSPEPLVRLEEGMAMTRPIAGTRRRGATAKEDRQLEAELLKDPKERAEHLMLVDLGRNDLGRVCEPGTVHVPDFMVIERYSHVMHIVSEVRGQLKKGQDAFDLMAAAFPAGTVSGAPKIRAMEIIDDLETHQRGPYAGAVGYFTYSGNMDMAITIRTVVWDAGIVSVQTGAGLVADSDPSFEYQETENKAAGVKKAVELAESGHLFLERA